MPDLVLNSCQPIGYQEIAELLDVKDTTVRMWKWGDKLPEPDYDAVHGFPAWEMETIIRWAGVTCRARSPKLRQMYRDVTGEEPPEAHNGGRPPTKTAETVPKTKKKAAKPASKTKKVAK